MAAKPILTENQRWLLRCVGGWEMRDCLISSEGVARLMQSMYSSTGSRIDGGPDWLARGFDCRKSTVVSRGAPSVKVTDVQINRYAAQLDAGIKAQLIECQHADRAENQRVWKWCRCGHEERCLRANQGDPFYGNRYHPTDAEVEAHYEEHWRIRDWTDDLLDLALGFEYADDAEPLGQLSLFEMAS